MVIIIVIIMTIACSVTTAMVIIIVIIMTIACSVTAANR